LALAKKNGFDLAVDGEIGAYALTYPLRRDDCDFVVFCFARLEDAAASAERFGGERLSVTQQ
jgi:hypothetical protein